MVNSRQNFNLPTFQQLGLTVDSHAWPLHAKPITTIDLDALLSLAVGTPFFDRMSLAVDFCRVAATYAPVPPVNLTDSRCALTSPQVEWMINNDFWAPIPQHEVLGVMRVFLRPEGDKDPPRNRVIHWCYKKKKRPTSAVGACPLGEKKKKTPHGTHPITTDGETGGPWGVLVQLLCVVVWYFS